MTGKTIYHYKILEKLGGGGMGVVYKAQDTKLDRFVALKFLPPEWTRDPQAKARFLQEARAASKLDHTNICTIHEINETEPAPGEPGDGQMFIAMAYYDGETLKERVTRGELQVADAIDISIQIAQGLSCAHEAGIIHRDIKPANVLITKTGEVKIVDFGLAKLAGRQLTKAGTTMGTVAYLCFDRARGMEATPQSDIWSLGVAIYEMLTGQLPFKGEHDQVVLLAILNEEPEPVANYRTDIPAALQQIIDRCLSKESKDRYQATGELLTDLEPLRNDPAPLLASRKRTVAVKSRRFLQRKILWPAGILVGVILTVYLLLNIFSPNADQPSAAKMKIAVLPFENLSSDEDEYFADGITDAITARLAALPGLSVISRQSAMQYKNNDKDIRQIGEELGVSFILDGTIQRERNVDRAHRIRLIPQLIKVSDDTHIWANIYEEEMTEVFRVQSEIAEKVARALDIALLEPDRRALAAVPTDNLEAHDYYLRGNGYLNQPYSRPNVDSAIEMFGKAIELDANFTLAYAKLSYARLHLAHIFYQQEELQMAKQALDIASQLEPDLPEVQIAEGYYYYYGERDYEKALEHFTSIQRRQPNNAEILYTIGLIHTRLGHLKNAVEAVEQAVKLNPRMADYFATLGRIYATLRMDTQAKRYLYRAIAVAPEIVFQYRDLIWFLTYTQENTYEARQVLNEAYTRIDSSRLVWLEFSLCLYQRDYQSALSLVRMMPNRIERYHTKAQVYHLMNEHKLKRQYADSARMIWEKRIIKNPKQPNEHSRLGYCYAYLGRKEQAILEGKRATELHPVTKDAWGGHYFVGNLAEIYVILGEHETALDLLKTIIAEPIWPGNLSPLALHPIWGPLRENPRFKQLMKKYRRTGNGSL